MTVTAKQKCHPFGEKREVHSSAVEKKNGIERD
jgi:hypothetical protein